MAIDDNDSDKELMNRLRVTHKMRSGDVARALGCKQNSVRRWELGAKMGRVLSARLRAVVEAMDNQQDLPTWTTTTPV